MKNICVIFGGKSVEHDISIITAMQVLSHLPKGYNFIPVYIDRDNHFWLADNLDKAQTFLDFSKNAKNKRACSFVAGASRLTEVKNGKFKKSCFIHGAVLCCHGGDGEGGALQGMLKLCKIPFTSPDFKSSAICMDKVLSKLILDSKNIKTIDFVDFYYDDFIENKSFYIEKVERELGYPVIIKPSRLGSSVGVHICANREEFYNALEIANEYDCKILVEKYLTACKEYACACMQINGKIFLSRVDEINKTDIYTFQDKYLSKKVVTKKVDKSLQEEIKKLTSSAYKYLECSGLVRVDFLYSPKEHSLYICEVNTIPGSLAFNLFEGVAFSDLISNLIENSLQENEKQDPYIYSFTSDAIKHYITISNTNKLAK